MIGLIQYFALFTLSLGISIGAFLYYQTFSSRIIKQIYQNFAEIFLKESSRKSICPEKAHLPTHSIVKLSTFLWLFMGECFLTSLFSFHFSLTLWLSLFFAGLILISLLDLAYLLIPPELCQSLFILSLVGAKWKVLPLTLEESIVNGIIAFLLFYTIFYFAKWYYQKEALGRGDCWLMLPIGSVLPIEQLPLQILIASLLGLAFMGWKKQQKKYTSPIPFAPFLSASASLVLLFTIIE